MLLLERAWGNEPGLLTVLALCAALVCQRAWSVDQRHGIPFLRSRWAHLCLATLAIGTVALGTQLFWPVPGSLPGRAPAQLAAASPVPAAAVHAAAPSLAAPSLAAPSPAAPAGRQAVAAPARTAAPVVSADPN